MVLFLKHIGSKGLKRNCISAVLYFFIYSSPLLHVYEPSAPLPLDSCGDSVEDISLATLFRSIYRLKTYMYGLFSVVKSTENNLKKKKKKTYMYELVYGLWAGERIPALEAGEL